MSAPHLLLQCLGHTCHVSEMLLAGKADYSSRWASAFSAIQAQEVRESITFSSTKPLPANLDFCQGYPSLLCGLASLRSVVICTFFPPEVFRKEVEWAKWLPCIETNTRTGHITSVMNGAGAVFLP